VAFVERASSQDLLDKTIKAYPDDEVLQCCLEMAPFTGTEGFRLGFSAILSKGRFEETDAFAIMLVQSQKDLTTQQFKQLFEVLKKHPEQYEKLKKQIEQLTEFLDKMEKLI
jgi:hypothetical protein